MKLIDKDALVAEIIKIYDRNRSNGFIDVCDELDNILSFLDTSEVKEVDLEEEIDSVWDNTSDNFSEDGWKEFEYIAKHFFELGLKSTEWKPSDKQIYSLDRVLSFYGKGTAVYDSVKELLKQLKKLKEE